MIQRPEKVAPNRPRTKMVQVGRMCDANPLKALTSPRLARNAHHWLQSETGKSHRGCI